MESKVKLMGHPVHPMLIVFPLGLLASAVAFDVIYYLTDRPGIASVSFYNLIGGVLMGLVAGVVGLVDWLAIPHATRAKRIGALHGLGNVVVLLLFTAAWLIRRGDPLHLPSTGAFVLELIALALAAVTGWLGGELVDRLGVGVAYGANLNAPSSLSGKPALPLQAKTGGQLNQNGRSVGPRLVHTGRN